MTSTKADLRSIDDQNGRGLFSEIGDAVSDAAGSVRDLFTGVSENDIANGRADLDTLSRAEKIELLVDKKTSAFGRSPWEIGRTFDPSVTDLIRSQKGSLLVLTVEADALDALQSVARGVRYALVWDDSIVADVGTVTVDVFGKTILFVTVQPNPQGQQLTLWVTDGDLQIALAEQAPASEANAVKRRITGALGAEGDKEPGFFDKVSDAFGGFMQAQTIGLIALLGATVVVVIVIVKSDVGKDLARVAANRSG